MTSTMSLAARICSSVAGAIRPAMVRPVALLAAHHFVNQLFTFTAGCPGVDQVFGFGRGRFDQEALEVRFGQLSDEGLVEDRLLQAADGGNGDIPKCVLLGFGRGGYFLGRVLAGIEEGEADDEKAGIADAAAEHAEIILALAEDVAAGEFLADLPFDEAEDQFDGEGGGDVNRDKA